MNIMEFVMIIVQMEQFRYIIMYVNPQKKIYVLKIIHI